MAIVPTSHWLRLDEIAVFLPLMRRKGVSKVARGIQPSVVTREGFLEAYEQVHGSVEAMRHRLARPNESWARRRENFIARHMAQIRQNQEALYDNKGRPTRRHLGLIAWAYSPDPELLRVARRQNPAPSYEGIYEKLSELDAQAGDALHAWIAENGPLVAYVASSVWKKVFAPPPPKEPNGLLIALQAEHLANQARADLKERDAKHHQKMGRAYDQALRAGKTVPRLKPPSLHYVSYEIPMHETLILATLRNLGFPWDAGSRYGYVQVKTPYLFEGLRKYAYNPENWNRIGDIEWQWVKKNQLLRYRGAYTTETPYGERTVILRPTEMGIDVNSDSSVEEQIQEDVLFNVDDMMDAQDTENHEAAREAVMEYLERMPDAWRIWGEQWFDWAWTGEHRSLEPRDPGHAETARRMTKDIRDLAAHYDVVLENA